MNSIILQWVLLADRASWKRMGEGVSGDGAMLSTNELLGLCALAVGIVVLVSVLSGLANRADSKQHYNAPKRLFRQLCDAHHLSRRDRGALKKLADHLQLSQPALLLVQPDNFPLRAWPAELEPYAEQLAGLYKRLFGTEIDRSAG